MLVGHALVLLLAAAGPGDPQSRARAELDACAERIEVLKATGKRGYELDRLLRRAQELAAELERASAEDVPSLVGAGPSPEELRERADAARDEADRLAAEIAALDVKIEDARRSSGEPEGVQRAALGAAAAPSPAAGRAHALAVERAALSERRARAEADAARLEAEAGAAER